MRIGGSWSQEHELERRLRDERPQPREAFVLMLSPTPSSMPAPPPRRTGLARVAVVVVVTAAIAVALAKTGSVGYASSSLHNAGHTVAHALRRPKGDTVISVTPYGPSSRSQSPFQVQAGLTAAVCKPPLLIAVPIQEVFYLLLHGAKPPSACGG